MFVEQSGTFPQKFNGTCVQFTPNSSSQLPSDLPAADLLDRSERSKQLLPDILGCRANNDIDRRTWGLLTGLTTHDVSMMRDFIGMPRDVIAARRSKDGLWIWIMFQ